MYSFNSLLGWAGFSFFVACYNTDITKKKKLFASFFVPDVSFTLTTIRTLIVFWFICVLRVREQIPNQLFWSKRHLFHSTEEGSRNDGIRNKKILCSLLVVFLCVCVIQVERCSRKPDITGINLYLLSTAARYVTKVYGCDCLIPAYNP